MLSRVLLGFVFALPAFLLTNESFTPLDLHVEFSDAHPYEFTLERAAPLYLEYALTVRSSAGTRVPAVVDLNGTTVLEQAAPRQFAAVTGKVLLPRSAARDGTNRLTLRVGGTEATGALRGRVQNYFGIAPDFPRIFVVADEQARADAAVEPLARRGLRLLVCLLLGVAWAVAVWRTPVTPGRRWVVASAIAWLPWAMLIVSAASPLHVWLSPGATAVAAAVGVLAAAIGALTWTHRRPVATVAAIVLVNVVALELALRAFNAVHPTFVFYSTGYARYRGQPGAPLYDTRLNSGGFNDVEHAHVRPPYVTHRIVALGDSFALGVVPYREHFLTRLEGELSAHGAVEVVNMGIAATEPADYLSLLISEGLAYHPDTVLACVFMGNDFEVPRRRWYDDSYVATLVRTLWRLRDAAATGPADAARAGGHYDDDAASLPRDRFLEIEVDRAWLYVLDEPRLPAAVARVAGELRQMRDVSARIGARFVVVLIPDESQVSEELTAEVVRASGRDRGELDFDRPNVLLAARLQQDGIAVIDLLPAFRHASGRTRLYKPQDTHWNIAGNRLAAAEIAAGLRAMETGAVPAR